MGRVFDCFSLFNELDLLKVRWNELNNAVDVFVLVEATRTFQKKTKTSILCREQRQIFQVQPQNSLRNCKHIPYLLFSV
jgi:beta-1,4-mannosyl-glycoprotein beta-1,4-N-acetylglucosaminyltransferase